MLFATNIAVDQEVIVVVIVISLVYLYAADGHQHTFITSRVTALLHNSEVQPVAALNGGLGGHAPPSFLLNFPFKFL